MPSPSIDPAKILAANQTACSAFQDQSISSGMAELMGQITADVNTSPKPAQFNTPIRLFELVDPSTAADSVKTALKSFNDYTKIYYAIPLGKARGDDLRKLTSQYRAVMTACKPFTVAKAAVFTITCKVGTDYNVKFATIQEAWSGKSDYCQAARTSGTEYSDQQKNAVAAAIGNTDDMTQLENLYAQCAQIDGVAAKPKEPLKGDSIKILQGILILCPDHPQAALIQGNIDAAGAVVASVDAQAQAISDGKYAKEGKHLVGPDIQPGTWQSVGDKVEDCYWETSDASGNIMANNFISIAPQFTITIPSDAAGFTNTGCAFQWIGG